MRGSRRGRRGEGEGVEANLERLICVTQHSSTNKSFQINCSHREGDKIIEHKIILIIIFIEL